MCGQTLLTAPIMFPSSKYKVRETERVLEDKIRRTRTEFANHLNNSLSRFDFFNIPVPLGLHWKGNLRLRTAAAPRT